MKNEKLKNEKLKNEEFNKWVSKLEKIISGETSIESISPKQLYNLFDWVKQNANIIVEQRTIKDPDSFDFTEIEKVAKLYKQLFEKPELKNLHDEWFSIIDQEEENTTGWLKQKMQKNEDTITDF